jgi:hypothetical protein
MEAKAKGLAKWKILMWLELDFLIGFDALIYHHPDSRVLGSHTLGCLEEAHVHSASGFASLAQADTPYSCHNNER